MTQKSFTKAFNLFAMLFLEKVSGKSDERHPRIFNFNQGNVFFSIQILL